MRCRISSSLLNRLAAQARAAEPEEVCGLLLGSRGEIADAVAVSNRAADPRTSFEIDAGTHLALSRVARGRGQAVIGCYHSHPLGLATPSEEDRKRAWQDGFYWLILARDDARLWIAGTSCGVMRFRPVPLDAETIALQPAVPEANRRPAWA